MECWKLISTPEKEGKIKLTSFAKGMLEELHFFNDCKNIDEALDVLNKKYSDGVYSLNELALLSQLEKEYWRKKIVQKISRTKIEDLS